MSYPDYEAHERAEARWAILRALCARRPQHVGEQALYGAVLQAHVETTRAELSRDLSYLEGKGLVAVKRNPATARQRACITPDGVDVAEYTSDDVIGVARPAGGETSEMVDLRTARWRIIEMLCIASPQAASERLILRAICDDEVGISEASLRRELLYLQERTLVEVEQGDVWRAKLTSAGVDVYEYQAAAPTSVARPPHHWR